MVENRNIRPDISWSLAEITSDSDAVDSLTYLTQTFGELSSFETNREIDEIFPEDDEPDTTSDIDIASLDEFDTSRNLLKLYLHEAGRTPLLTDKEELQLGKLVQEGLLATETLRADDETKTLSDRDKEKLELIKQEGDKAQEHFVKANLRLAISIAKKYQNRGLTLLDLIQEANAGVMRAVSEYDYKKGYRFSTYATYWIKRQVSNAVMNQGNTIYIPTHTQEALGQIKNLREFYLDEFDREPDRDALETLYNTFYPNSSVSFKHAYEVSQRKIADTPRSLDRPLYGIDGDIPLSNFIKDQQEDTEEAAIGHVFSTEIQKIAESFLSEREWYILKHRFEIQNCKRKTHPELSKEFNVSVKRIGMIEKRALEKLRVALQEYKEEIYE